MKIKIPPMQPEDGVAGITLNRIFEARDQQWLELVGPVVEALILMIRTHDEPAESLLQEMREQQWLAKARAALRAIIEERQ